MKIALVAPEDLPIPPTRGGSVQIYVHALASALCTIDGVEPVVISPRHNHRHHNNLVKRHDFSGIQHLRLDANSPKAYQALVLSTLASIQPDVIQVENRPLFAAAVKRRIGTPTVLNLHSTTFLGPLHAQHAALTRSLRGVDSIVCNSRYLQRSVAKRFRIQSESNRLSVIYPGIDLNRFTYHKRMVSQFSRSRPLRVLFVGRVVRQKGVLVLVRAVRQLHQAGYPVRLTVVGRTPPWERRYGDQVRREAQSNLVDWVGFVSQKALPRYYHRHDVFVCPSQDKEAFGLVNLEALATGLPVIASQVGGIPEAVTSDTGILVKEPRNAVAFSRALTTCLTHPERLLEWSAKGRLRAEQFAWESTGQEFVKLYQGLLRNSRE